MPIRNKYKEDSLFETVRKYVFPQAKSRKSIAPHPPPPPTPRKSPYPGFFSIWFPLPTCQSSKNVPLKLRGRGRTLQHEAIS